MTTSSVADRLAELRGPVPSRHHDARTLAALTANPGCTRRAVLDAAGVDKRALAERIGFGPRFGQSPFAISRGNAFERLVKSDGGAALLALLRDELGLRPAQDDQGPDQPVDGAGPADPGLIDLSRGDREERYRRTRDLVVAAARDPQAAPLLADHPLLRLEVGGRAAYVEPDLVALRARGRDGSQRWRWYLAEIKSFAVIDGHADPMKVAEAATQAAVYVLAFQRLLAGLGLPDDLVATDVVLICPKDFGNAPCATLIDVRRQLAAVRRQLERLPRIGALLDGLEPDLSFDLSADAAGRPSRSAAQLGEAVAAVRARYAPECISRCDMAFYCRDEARVTGSTDLLGRAVRDALGGLGTMRDVLALSERAACASPGGYDSADSGCDGGDVGDVGDGDLAEAARLLNAARRARREALAQAGVSAAGNGGTGKHGASA
ncbi:hypothetical protein KGA66_11810 [Actinocrinis puniceicyclus]|uniref:Secreted protein n=1 Tax=Actinocrinis puniceicyclus TaxID=977794 RepID=A0A8J7WM05_9ACTN|nr:hypothetical protein [Actinocrinis puniceicyclus]MBS2963738.1 hypothetical protein [Actinocrinis puniceicyclus]